jgi:hypothetical protein
MFPNHDLIEPPRSTSIAAHFPSMHSKVERRFMPSDSQEVRLQFGAIGTIGDRACNRGVPLQGIAYLFVGLAIGRY